MRNKNGSLSSFGFILVALGVLGVVAIVFRATASIYSPTSPDSSGVPTSTPGMSSLEILRITRTAEALATQPASPQPVNFRTPGYDGATRWEDESSKRIRLEEPIPAGAIISIRGPRFPSGSGLFSVWVLDEDQVKEQLLMNTTSSLDSESFRLREDAYYFKVETTDSFRWRIEIDRLP